MLTVHDLEAVRNKIRDGSLFCTNFPVACDGNQFTICFNDFAIDVSEYIQLSLGRFGAAFILAKESLDECHVFSQSMAAIAIEHSELAEHLYTAIGGKKRLAIISVEELEAHDSTVIERLKFTDIYETIAVEISLHPKGIPVGILDIKDAVLACIEEDPQCIKVGNGTLGPHGEIDVIGHYLIAIAFSGGQ